VASPAAGVEHIFSSDGLVQSKLCCQLSNDKASKLVFLYRWLAKPVKHQC